MKQDEMIWIALDVDEAIWINEILMNCTWKMI
jgi:hypothetical protein